MNAEPSSSPSVAGPAGAGALSALVSSLRARFFTGENARYRWAVASRAVAAIGGGYVVAALASSVLAVFLPFSRAEATMTGMLTSFLVYAGAVIWVFSQRSAWRAWAGLALPSLAMGAVLWLQLKGAAA